MMLLATTVPIVLPFVFFWISKFYHQKCFSVEKLHEDAVTRNVVIRKSNCHFYNYFEIFSQPAYEVS